MITIESLQVSYAKEEKVINSLNLSMPGNMIHGIVGLNGAGKTTLLNAIFGLKSVDAGSILHNGLPLSRKAVAFLETENFFYSNITGREYLEIFIGTGFDADEWNRLFLLPLDNIIDEYSTGMKKKLALMSLLKQNKPIMILDEPFNGLDIETCRIIRQVLLKMKTNGRIIIVTSHIIETLTNLCDYIHFLEGGVIKFTKGEQDFREFEKAIFESIETRNEELINTLLGRQNK